MNRKDIARELSELFGVPIKGYRGESYDIVQALVGAMTSALCRGEDIVIDGFGTFTHYTPPPKRFKAYFYPYLGKGLHSEVMELPPSRKIIFKPSKALYRYVNGNYSE